MTANVEPSPEIIYVGDPMCSWCWGFAPVLDQLVSEHEVPFRVVVGGLRPGPSAEALEPTLRGYLRNAWQQVAAASGQPFDLEALEARPDTWLYDTELPARAVVTMRTMSPDQELAFFLRLQRAFYAEGLDITAPDTYPALLEPFAVDDAAFVEALRSEASRQAAWADFAWAQQRGVRGFPTTLLRVGDRLRMLAGGFVSYEQVDGVLHGALQRFAPDNPVTAAVCAVDGNC